MKSKGMIIAVIVIVAIIIGVFIFANKGKGKLETAGETQSTAVENSELATQGRGGGGGSSTGAASIVNAGLATQGRAGIIKNLSTINTPVVVPHLGIGANPTVRNSIPKPTIKISAPIVRSPIQTRR